MQSQKHFLDKVITQECCATDFTEQHSSDFEFKVFLGFLFLEICFLQVKCLVKSLHIDGIVNVYLNQIKKYVLFYLYV